MMISRRLYSAIAIIAILVCFCSEVNGQSVRRSGYSGNVEVGALAQEYPYISVSSSHGVTNKNGLFFGGGVLFEMPAVVSPVFKDDKAPYPGPFEKEKMLGVFAEVRYAFGRSSFAPFLDLKAGPAYNLDSKSYQNAFVRPSAGICFGHLAVSAGVEAAIGEYVVEGQREQHFEDIERDLYGSFLPYLSIGIFF